jgi:hypothetical protein
MRDRARDGTSHEQLQGFSLFLGTRQESDANSILAKADHFAAQTQNADRRGSFARSRQFLQGNLNDSSGTPLFRGIEISSGQANVFNLMLLWRATIPVMSHNPWRRVPRSRFEPRSPFLLKRGPFLPKRVFYPI